MVITIHSRTNIAILITPHTFEIITDNDRVLRSVVWSNHIHTWPYPFSVREGVVISKYFKRK